MLLGLVVEYPQFNRVAMCTGVTAHQLTALALSTADTLVFSPWLI